MAPNENSGVIEAQSVDVGGVTMAYTDHGQGRPIVFLHGGIGSVYTWRNVVPSVAWRARCIAVDLPGSGWSDRIDGDAYSWDRQAANLGSFLDALSLDTVTLVMHGWASIPGLTWAMNNRRRIEGLAYMEAITRPLAAQGLPESLRGSLRRARSNDGQRYVMDSDEYLDESLAVQLRYPLSPGVQAEYRKALGPFGETRRALHTALVEVPIGGKPAASAAHVRKLGAWLKRVWIPKLLILGEPGYVLSTAGRRAALNVPNQSVVRVSGAHLLPEESPEPVGMFLNLWLEQRR